MSITRDQMVKEMQDNLSKYRPFPDQIMQMKGATEIAPGIYMRKISADELGEMKPVALLDDPLLDPIIRDVMADATIERPTMTNAPTPPPEVEPTNRIEAMRQKMRAIYSITEIMDIVKDVMRMLDNRPLVTVDDIKITIPLSPKRLDGYEIRPNIYYGGVIVASVYLTNGKVSTGLAVASPNDDCPDIEQGIGIALDRAMMAYWVTWCGMEASESRKKCIIPDKDGNVTLGPSNCSPEMLDHVVACIETLNRP